MASRLAIRQKVVVVPYTFHPCTGEKMYVMIQDKESNDWSFVTGGKKMRETYREAAMRELAEETKGVVLDSNNEAFLSEVGAVVTDHRPPKHKKADREQNIHVRTLYRIFELPVRFQPDLRVLFRQAPMGTEDETSDICYMNKENILRPGKHQETKKIWTLVQKELAPAYFERSY